MARPELCEDDRRSGNFTLRLTEGERVRLEHTAASLGMTLAEFMRGRGLGYRMPRRAAQRHADAFALATLNRLGVNLNQITHHLNAGWATAGTDADLQALIGDIRTVMRGLMHGPKADSRRPVV